MNDHRPPAVAGLFYPASASALRQQVDALLNALPPAWSTAKAIIVPHAGYLYSGAVAAAAFAGLRWRHDTIRRVVLLGPVHHVPVRGLASTSATAFETPLGTVPVDQKTLAGLANLPQVVISDAAHAPEHSLEVQLPFLQTVLGKFELLPFAVGDATAAEVAEVLERVWGGDETLIVVSSDLSHYHPYRAARAMDRDTAAAILALLPLSGHAQACGATPINGLLAAVEGKGLRPRLLDLRNSGDTAGDKSLVVGYAAFAFEQASDGR